MQSLEESFVIAAFASLKVGTSGVKITFFDLSLRTHIRTLSLQNKN